MRSRKQRREATCIAFRLEKKKIIGGGGKATEEKAESGKKVKEKKLRTGSFQKGKEPKKMYTLLKNILDRQGRSFQPGEIKPKKKNQNWTRKGKKRKDSGISRLT